MEQDKKRPGNNNDGRRDKFHGGIEPETVDLT